MPVIPDFAPPKGNANMTLLNERIDDTTVAFPQMPFHFFYNKQSVDVIYSSGNTWVGFGSGTEHLDINRKDTSCNKIFYANETEHGLHTFRIRFEGNSHYSSWNINDLVWEFTVFEDGVFQLIIEKSPQNGTDSFVNPTIGTVACTFEMGKSYVFLSETGDGTAYTISAGSYVLCDNKYLMSDAEGVKAYNATLSAWGKVAEPPLTKAMFMRFGVDNLPNNLAGLLDIASVHFFTNNPKIIAEQAAYKLNVKEIITSKPQMILQTVDFPVEVEKVIESLELRTKLLGDGSIKFAISFDGGVTFYTFKAPTGFEVIDISNIETFAQSGIESNISNLDYVALNKLCGDKIRFAYLLIKPTLTDICKLKAVKITYAE